MSLADGTAWEQEFGVSEASKAVDAKLLAQVSPNLTGRDPMGVFPTPSSAADVPCTFQRSTTGGDLPFMPTVEMTPALRAQIDKAAGDRASNYLQVAAAKPIEVRVYLDNGVVYTYDVETLTSAREHAAAIVKDGYRSVQAETPDVFTHFPPHRILKVKVNANGVAFKTDYFDKTTGT